MSEASMNSINQLKDMIERNPKSKADFLRPKQGAIKYNMSRTSFTKLMIWDCIRKIIEQLTLLYFVLNFIGSLLAGAGWIVGIIVFVITAVCWLFGQFNAWYQPVIGIMIAVGICFLPIVLTDFGSSAILKIKGLLHSVI